MRHRTPQFVRCVANATERVSPLDCLTYRIHITPALYGHQLMPGRHSPRWGETLQHSAEPGSRIRRLTASGKIAVIRTKVGFWPTAEVSRTGAIDPDRSVGLVESGCDAVTLGPGCLLPPLSSDGAQGPSPSLRFHTHRVARGDEPPPAPTERSVPISGTTLVDRGFTAQRGSAADHRSAGAVDAVAESARALG